MRDESVLSALMTTPTAVGLEGTDADCGFACAIGADAEPCRNSMARGMSTQRFICGLRRDCAPDSGPRKENATADRRLNGAVGWPTVGVRRYAKSETTPEVARSSSGTAVRRKRLMG